MSSTLPPLDLYFAFHLHQPTGNFGEVISDHVTNVYRPLLNHLSGHHGFPIAVHVSGSLLEWCEKYDHSLIDELALLASEGRVEFLLAGFYEPVLASIPVADRITQILWLHEWLLANMGVSGEGLWLTERVWEPDLTRDLVEAGIRYALVDDRHFLVSGHHRGALDAVFRTEHDGRYLDLFPIDEKLRYLIPFQPVSEIAAHFRQLRANGHRFAVFADDAEKFGGWPNTREWVYGSGWLDEFLETMVSMQESGEVRLLTGHQARNSAARGGITYLSSASYHEMEEWSLSPDIGRRYEQLRRDLGEERLAGPDGALVRGAHWKHFLVKYPESNRMHKHMLALSGLCRSHGDPEAARRAIGRAQSNDPFWHGVFGGLYLPWLRESAWRNLAEAERMLRSEHALDVTVHDHDGDGRDEFWIHNDTVSVVVAPHRGGAIELWLLLAHGINGADTLTRRIEAYHYAAVAPHPATTEAVNGGNDADGGIQSIHDAERSHRLAQLPPADNEIRSLLQSSIVDGSITEEAWQDASYLPIESFASEQLEGTIASHSPGEVTVAMLSRNYKCTTTVQANGDLEFDISWSKTGFPIDAQFAVELSLAPRVNFRSSCDCGRLRWEMPIITFARSERGLEQTVQGQAVLFLIPIAKERVRITLGIDASQSAE